MNYKWIALIIVSVGSFMGSLDTSIVNISFPRLVDVFDTSLSVVVWVNIVFLLVSTSLMLFVGRIGDMFGRKRVYLIGFAFFIAGLTVCSFAPNIFVLIAGRVVQGIGGAVLTALSMAIATDTFPDHERGKAVGIVGSVISAGVLTGPVLGGILLDTLGWSSVFYIRIPIAAAGLMMSWLLLKESKVQNVSTKLDLPGAALIFSSLSCILLFFNLGEEWGFTSVSSLILIGAAVVLLVLFILQERRHSNPVVDLSMFKNWGFASNNMILGIMALAISAHALLIPFYLLDGLGYSGLYAGLMMGASTLVSLTVAPVSGWLSDKIGTTLLSAVGVSLVCLSFFFLSGLSVESSVADILIRFVLFGFGLGTFMSPNTSSIMGSSPRNRLGTASAIMNSVRQIGMSVGFALIGMIFAIRQSFYNDQFAGEVLDPERLERLSVVGGFQDAMLVSSIICGIGIVAAISSILRKRGTKKQSKLNHE